MVRRKNISNARAFSDAENLDIDEFEDEGFIDGSVNFGKPIASFSFNPMENLDSKAPQPHYQLISQKPNAGIIPDDQIYRATPRGLTPPVNGEHFTAKRSYQLRPSTVRKLNELRAKHPDINVYLNTIVDAAILYYHNYIVNEGGKF